MKSFLRLLSLYQVVICVEVKSQSGNVFTGTEGGSVAIMCKYPDGYQFVSKYFCRDPCGYSDVLIETEKANKVISKGRYSILNTVSARSISVTIKNLRAGDSGVYHCGVDKWGKDIFSKVEVSVRRVHSVTFIYTPAPESGWHQITHSTTERTPTSPETTELGYDVPALTREASSTLLVSEAELVVFGVLFSVTCAMLVVVLFFLYRDPCLRSSTGCTCSSSTSSL